MIPIKEGHEAGSGEGKKHTGLRLYTFFFIMTSTIFIGLTPRFYGFLIPVIFLIPVFVGLAGIKKRDSHAVLFSFVVLPGALMSGITRIKYYVEVAHPAFYEVVAESALRWRVTFTAARLLIVVPSILGLVLVFFALITAYLGYRCRKMFKSGEPGDR